MAVSLDKISFIDKFMKQLGIISIAAVIISFVAIIYLGYEWWSIRTTIIEDTKVLAKKEAEVARTEIDNQLKFAMQTSQQLADDLTSGKLPYKQIDGVLKNKFISTRDDQSKSSFLLSVLRFAKVCMIKTNQNSSKTGITITTKNAQKLLIENAITTIPVEQPQNVMSTGLLSL
jgi:predicted transcriptional regulator